VALRPITGHGLLILEVSRSHTTMHHSRYDSSEWVISSSQRPLTTLTTDRHPCPRWDSNPQSQQASGADLRLRLRGYWDRLMWKLHYAIRPVCRDLCTTCTHNVFSRTLSSLKTTWRWPVKDETCSCLV